MARHHPAVRPFQRLAVDVFLEQTFFHHQPQIRPGAPPWRICGFIDDVAQIVQTTGLHRASFVQPRLARLPPLPRAGGKAEDFNLDVATFQRTGQNIRTDRSDRDRTAPHRTGIIQQQGHAGVAKLSVFFDLEGQGRGGVGHDSRQSARVQRAFLQIKLP